MIADTISTKTQVYNEVRGVQVQDRPLDLGLPQGRLALSGESLGRFPSETQVTVPEWAPVSHGHIRPERHH